MNDLILYHFPRSSCSRKVTFALAAKQLTFKSVLVDLRENQQKSADFLRLNPKGQVPVLVHAGRPVSDSSVINELLEDIAPERPLLPADPLLRARARWLALQADRCFYPAVAQVLAAARAQSESGLRDGSVAALAQGVVAEHFPLLESASAVGDPLLVGDLSLADIAYAPVLDNFMRVAGVDLAGWPHIRAWFDRVRGLASFRAADPLKP